MAESRGSTQVVAASTGAEGAAMDEESARPDSGRTSYTGAAFDVETQQASERPSRDPSSMRTGRPQSAFLLETLEDEHSEASSFPEIGEAQQEEPEPPRPRHKQRIYYLDWLRILAIYLVVFYHCIQALNMVHLWRGSEHLHIIAYQCSSLQVGMPVFFHISGRAQALTKQKRMRNTLSVRFQRLLIPFFLAYFLLIPFWQYVQMRDENPDSPKIFILWLFWFFQPDNYKFHTGWLWFLPTLFVIGVLASPVFLLAEERSTKYAVASAVVWLGFFSLLEMFSGFTWWTFGAAALGPIFACIVVMFVPFPPRNSNTWSSERWLAVQLTTFLTILTQFGLVCSFRYKDISEAWKPAPAFLLFLSFYVHGYFVQRWNVGAAEAEREAQAARLLARRESPNHQSSDSHSNDSSPHTGSTLDRNPNHGSFTEKLPLWAGIWQLLVVGIMLLSVSVGSPVGEWEAELFPIYSASYKDSPFFGAAHIAGTWAMIGLVVSWFQAYANKEFHPLVYKHGTTSVIVVYIFHWAFIAPFAFWVCRDFDMMEGGWKLVDPLLTLVVGCLGPAGLYVFFLRVPALGRLFGM